MTTATAPPLSLRWHVTPDTATAVLGEGWKALGETRSEVPLDELAGWLGAEGDSARGGRLSAHLGDAGAGSWVYYARRLREQDTAFADVLVQGTATPDGVQGTVLDLTQRLVGLGPHVAGSAERALAFSQELTHQLRVSLRQVRDCLELIRLEQGSPHEVDKWTRLAESSLARARLVACDAYELLQVVDGRKSVALEVISLAAVAPALARLHLRAAQEAGQTLSVEVGEDAAALVDFAGLTAVMDNLIGNAVRHSGRGSTIRVSVGRDADGLPRVIVADNGKAFDARLLPQMFEPFYRADTNAAGSGLGLTLVLELCRAMGASLLMHQNEYGGLTAEVHLQPAPQAEVQRAAA